MTTTPTSPPLPEEDEEDEWHYELLPAHELPMVDLSISVLSVFAGDEADQKFFGVMRRHYGKFVKLFRISTLSMLSTFVTPASVGYILTAITVCLSVGSLTFSVLMMSWQLLHHAIAMQEVGFMTIMNWLNWATLAVLFRDFRSLVCVLQAWAIQLSILSDAMFRTILSASKSSFLALPLLFLCVLIVFLRLADVPKEHYTRIHVNNIQIELADVFLNVSTTLCLLVARNIFRQRRAIAGAATKLIPSAMLKAKLMLKPATRASLNTRGAHLLSAIPRPPLPPDTPAEIRPPPRELTSPPLAITNADRSYLQRIQSAQERRDSTEQPRPLEVVGRPPIQPRPQQGPTLTILPASGPTAEMLSARRYTSRRLRRARAAAAGYARRLTALSYTIRSALLTKAYDRSAPQLQQLRLVPSRLKFVDSRKTLLPCLTPQDPWSSCRIQLYTASGLTGLALTVVSALLLDRRHLVSPGVQRTLHVASLALSLPVVVASLATTQVTLLGVLAHNFDVLFNLFQFFSAASCLGAMVNWDERCLVPTSLGLWFLWVVAFDAITPRMRRRLGLRKTHAGVVHLAILVSLLSVVGSVVFDAENRYADAKIAEVSFYVGLRVEVRVKSFFLIRMFPLTVWGARLLWELLCCREEELLFIKGFLEYFCPLEMLPLPRARVTPTRSVTRS